MGAQFGYNFIPPFSAANNGLNSNLHLFGTDFAVGPGEHGFSANTSAPDLPHHTENTGILSHHQIEASNLDPYAVDGNGFFTSVITDENGVPWMNTQGVQMLWNLFFTEQAQVTKNEWSQDPGYYHALFGNYLSTFVRSFLKLIPAMISQGLNATQIQTIAANPTNPVFQQQIILMHQLSAAFPNYLELPFNTDNWNALNTVNNYFSTAPNGDNNWQKIFLGTATNSPPPLFQTTFPAISTLSLPAISGIDLLTKLWNLYATASDVVVRNNNILYWAYFVMIELLNTIQSSTEQQATRVTVLTNAQKTATSAMAKVKFVTFSRQSDVADQMINQQKNAYISTYRSIRAVAQTYQQQQSTAVEQTNSGMQITSSLISSVIQTIDSLISGIYQK